MRRTYLQTPRCNKSSEQKQPQFWVLHLFAHAPLWQGVVFSGSYKDSQNVDLKQNITYSSSKMNSGSAVKSNLGSATMVIQVQVLAQQEKENTFIEVGKRRWTGYGKQWVYVFTSAESLARKKRSISSSYWSPPQSQGVRAPASGLLIQLRFLFINFLRVCKSKRRSGWRYSFWHWWPIKGNGSKRTEKIT